MRKPLLLFCLLTVTYSNTFSQIIVFGINIEKSYPEIKLEKEFKLKDNSIFYSVKISNQGREFIYSTVQSNFEPFINPKKYHSKALSYIKKVFGEPLNIYTNTSFTSKTTDFYIWKVKKENVYFFVYYSLSFVLTFNIEKMHSALSINDYIMKVIRNDEFINGKTYYVKASELYLKNEN